MTGIGVAVAEEVAAEEAEAVAEATPVASCAPRGRTTNARGPMIAIGRGIGTSAICETSGIADPIATGTCTRRTSMQVSPGRFVSYNFLT